MTDLDGTAVLEREGSVVIPDIVSGSLTDLARLGCRVSINTLRFPLNVIRTFGREWYAITNARAAALVSLNGAQIGYLEERDEQIAFREIAAFPLSAADIDEVLVGVAGLLGGGIDDILLFFYGRDWTRGERIWTPKEARATAARERYRSASDVSSMPLYALRDALLGEEICMLMLLVNAEDDKLMAYQHVRRSSFVTRAGVDKAFGAEKLANLLDQDLGHTIGAGDTPMDSFLGAVGLACRSASGRPSTRGCAGQSGSRIRSASARSSSRRRRSWASADGPQASPFHGQARARGGRHRRRRGAPAHRRRDEQAEAEGRWSLQLRLRLGASEKGAFILRLGDGTDKLSDFRKECWAMRKAGEAGVPVAEVLAVGEEKGWAWMVQRRIEGEEGTHHPDRRKALWRWAG